MNDFLELEDELRKLRPVAPSEDLVARIERALAEPADYRASTAASRSPGWRWLWHLTEAPYKISLGFGLAAAAALLILARVELESPKQKIGTLASRAPVIPSGNAPAEFLPAGLTQIIYNTWDEGLHFRAGSDQPMRWVRSQMRETLQWRNPKTGASLRVSYPSEEISLIPVSGE